MIHKLFLQVQDKSSNKIKLVDNFITSYHEYNYDRQQQRIKLVTTTPNENDSTDEELGEINSSSIPMLVSLVIPF